MIIDMQIFFFFWGGGGVNKVHYVKMVNGNLSRRLDIFT